MQNIAANVHIDSRAEIGENVTIQPGVIINGPARIGNNVSIGAYTQIEGNVSLGEQVTIGPFAVLGAAPQDHKYQEEQSFVEIGPHTVIREYCSIHRGTGENTSTTIGAHCMLMAYSHVGHNCQLGNHVIMANAVQLSGHTTVEDYAIISGLTGTHQFIRIGKMAMIGGMSRINQDALPFIITNGNPPSIYGLNKVGLRRRGMSRETMQLLHGAYRVLFQSKMPFDEALKCCREKYPDTPEVLYLCDFISTSKRGVIH